MKRKLSIISSLVMVLLLLTGTFITGDAEETPVLVQSDFEEPKPSIEKDQGLVKVTFRLPKGVTAPDEGLRLALSVNLTDSKYNMTNTNKQIAMGKGTSSYTAYIPVSFAGDKAQCLVRYFPYADLSYESGYIPGFAGKNGTTVNNTQYQFELKQGGVLEIKLDAIMGVIVSGVIEHPSSAVSGQ